MKIAICDDNLMQREILEDLVREYLSDRELEATVELFVNGDDLLKADEENDGYDAYILDIIMPGTKGIAVGGELLKRPNRGKITYLTATVSFTEEASTQQNVTYLLKPVSADKLFAFLDDALK